VSTDAKKIGVFPGILFPSQVNPSTIADSNSGAVATGGAWIRAALDPEKDCREQDIAGLFLWMGVRY